MSIIGGRVGDFGSPLPALPIPSALGMESLVARVPGAGKEPDDRTVNDVATRFEGMFWSMLVKEMREGLEPGVLLGEDSGDILGGMFDLTMGEHLAQGHALGIAAMIRRQLKASKKHGHDADKHRTAGAPSRPVRAVSGAS